MLKEIELKGKTYTLIQATNGVDPCKACAFHSDSSDCWEAGSCGSLGYFVEKEQAEKPTQVNTPVDKTEKPQQGRKYDAGKPMYNLLPAEALEEVVMVLTKGAIKYNEPVDQENWRLVENPQARYFAAAQRHLWADKRGEFKDSGEGGTDCYHLACAISSLLFKLQLRIEEERKQNVE